MTDELAFFGSKTVDDREEELLTTLGRLLAHGGIDLILTSAPGATQAIRLGFTSAGGKAPIVDRMPYDRPWLVYINPSSAFGIIERFPVKAPETTWIAGVEKLEEYCEVTMAVLEERGQLPSRA